MTIGILTTYIPMVDAVPPMERVTLTSITTSEENDTLKIDEQVMINVDYIIQSNWNDEFTLIFQIADEDNKTVMLNWISGIDIVRVEYEDSVCGNNICEGKIKEIRSMSTSWIPSDSGEYYINVFAWEEIDHPTSFGPPVGKSIIVI